MTARRYPDGLELRAAAELRQAGRRLEGYASVFNAETRIGSFTEVVRPGAFAGSLGSGRDILGLADHDYGRLLGRTSSGTLRLVEDTRGLAFDLALPDTGLGRDMLALAERGDLGGASFAFRPVTEIWSAARDRRELRSVELVEISIVSSFPAYAGTSVAARARSRDATALRRLRLFVETL